jgi:hypothetical protein
MSERLLDGDQVHARQVELAGAEVPQHVRGERVGPGGQVRGGGLGQAGAQRVGTDPAAGAVGVAAFGGEQRSSGPGVVGVEVAPDVLDEPPQGPARIVDQRHHAFARAAAAAALADADVEFAEPAQVPLHVAEVEVAGLVDPQAHLRHQARGGVVACGRRELPAGRQLTAPPGEHAGHLRRRRWDPQRGRLVASRPVHLVDRALDDPAGELVDLDLVAKLQEPEVGAQRLRAGMPGAFGGAAQHLAEVEVGVRGFHVPQRPLEPGPDLIKIPDVVADRAVGQTR